MAGHGGGAWKVAYADFVTAMMAFFMVMWILAQGKPEVKKAIAQYFTDPFMSSKPSGGASLMPSDVPGDTFGGKPPAGGAKPRGRRSAESRPKPPPGEDAKTVGARKPSLTVLHDGEEKVEGAVVLFAEDSAELNESSKQGLNRLAPMLVGKRNKIELRGHATRRPLPPESPYRDAWQLCYARCLATMKFLEQQGIEADRIRLSQAGVFEPQTIRVEPEWEGKNSRVEVYVLGEIAEDLLGTRKERAERFRTP
jgi:chemotaxis protein MotB